MFNFTYGRGRVVLFLLLLCVGIIGGAGGTGGCSSRPTTNDKDVNLIGRKQLHLMLEDQKTRATLVIIDIRKPRLYAEGHIPSAINIAVIDLRTNDPKLNDAKTIVVYGSGKMNDLLSWAAGKKLAALGYVNVNDFRGGMSEWLGKGQYRQPDIDRRMEEKADQ